MKLAAALAERARLALASGALEPIETETGALEQDGVRFAVRRALAPPSRRVPDPARATADPFLPYDPALFVADLSATHVALLNKYPVADAHLLIVTRAFADQEEPLDAADFAALAGCLVELDGLAFHNAGVTAGASQRHKHLQLVSLPLAEGGPAVPIEAAFGRLPFAHALLPLAPGDLDPAGPGLAERYAALWRAAGLAAREPYNLLVTRRWMLLVPRVAERFEAISINALGFAGSFFVRDPAQLARLARAGPMRALCSVARAR